MMIDRRHFLQSLAALPAFSYGSGKPLRGIFPIMQTPFTSADAVDLPILAKQVPFLERCGVHGMVWPQLASEYYNLTKEERMAGVETILAAGKGIKPAIVIGVQADEAATATGYVRLATKLGADALIALPPRGELDWSRITTYYKEIGAASPLPLFVQAIGKVSVENIIDLAKAVPTLRYVKDEAGPVLSRLSELRQKAPEISAFTGGHSRTLLDEMMRGSAGTMPAAAWADLHATAWDAFQSGDRALAADLCAKSLLLISAVDSYGMHAVKYVLHLRGLFPNYIIRAGKNQSPDGGGNRTSPLDERAKRYLAELLSLLKPHLRA
ncbi:MAG: dihydrodipicolinate synthase family protein [Acidobacteriia bacterium]|nr:dihydrodipicolinate synthase family protein [Terriglobia bacterium]